MDFTYETAFAYLDGRTFKYREFYDEINRVRVRYFDKIGPNCSPNDMYRVLFQMGWITFPLDKSWGNDSTLVFKICEDVREVRKRINQYKEGFIREQALRWLGEFDEKVSDSQHVIDVDLKEYEQAIRELAEK